MPINHMTGNAIGMQMISQFASCGFMLEILYSFVIIVCSLMIYFGTKELYELSSHKGIKYFRLSFLFFAIAYFFRSFIKFIVMYFNIETIFNFSPKTFGILFGPATMFVFMYFSAMAIFYLLYSVMWKKLEKSPNKIYLFHFFAFIISLITIIFMNPFVYLWMNLLLLSCVIFIYYLSRKQSKIKKSKHNLHIIYTLLFSFWVLNIIDILIPTFFKTFQLFIYLASIFLFLLMLYKVIKKTGAN